MRIPGLSKLKADGSTEPITDETSPITDEQQYEVDVAETEVRQEQDKAIACRTLGRISSIIRKHGYTSSVEALIGRDLKALGIDTDDCDKDKIADQIDAVPGVEPIEEITNAEPATEVLLMEVVLAGVAVSIAMGFARFGILWMAEKFSTSLKSFSLDDRIVFYRQDAFMNELESIDKQLKIIEVILDSDKEQFDSVALQSSVKALGFMVEEDGAIEVASIERESGTYGELGWDEAAAKAVKTKFESFTPRIKNIARMAKEVADEIDEDAENLGNSSKISKEQRRDARIAATTFRELARHAMNSAVTYKKEFAHKFYRFGLIQTLVHGT